MSRPVLLCDADDCLFASEVIAFRAATTVVNALLADLGSAGRFTPEDLRRRAAGRSFRALARDLADELGAPLAEADLERRAADEQREVTALLERELAPDPEVSAALAALAAEHRLALVSSSALGRLDACLRATGLVGRFPRQVRFSAADSLPEPTSKPDPAVYAHAMRELGLTAGGALAIEDSVSGVRSAAGAGVPVVGNLHFVLHAERAARADALLAAGAVTVFDGWSDLVAHLGGMTSGPTGQGRIHA